MKTDNSIRKTYTHDRMAIKIKFSSGAALNFSATRNGETLDLRFSNDVVELKKQFQIVNNWLALGKGETKI